MICLAISFDPPEEIAEELRDLLEQVNFGRHLDLRGIKLSSEEFQLSITGNAVDFAMVVADNFLETVKYTKNIIIQTSK